MDIEVLKQDDYLVWIPFMEDAEVLVRHVNREELFELGKKATKRTWNQKHQPVEELDLLKHDQLLGRAAVKDWKGVTMKGEPYPYSEDSCDFLMTRWNDFAKFINNVCIDLQYLMEEEKKKKQKNSGTTSGPS